MNAQCIYALESVTLVSLPLINGRTAMTTVTFNCYGLSNGLFSK